MTPADEVVLATHPWRPEQSFVTGDRSHWPISEMARVHV